MIRPISRGLGTIQATVMVTLFNLTILHMILAVFVVPSTKILRSPSELLQIRIGIEVFQGV